MNQSAIIEQAKGLTLSGEMPTIREMEGFLRDAGLSAKATKALLARGYPGLRDADEEEEGEIAKLLQRLRDTIKNSHA